MVSGGGGMGFTYDPMTSTLKQSNLFNNTNGYTLISDNRGVGTLVTFNKVGSSERRLYNPMMGRLLTLPKPPSEMSFGSNHEYEQLFHSPYLFQLRHLNDDKTNTVLVYMDTFKDTKWSALLIASRVNAAIKNDLPNTNPRAKVTSLIRIGTSHFALAEFGSTLYVVKINLNMTDSSVTLGQAEITAKLGKHPNISASLFVYNNKIYVTFFNGNKRSSTDILSHQGKLVDRTTKSIQELMKEGEIPTNNNVVVDAGRILYALNGDTYTRNYDASKMFINETIHEFSIVKKNGKYFLQVLK